MSTVKGGARAAVLWIVGIAVLLQVLIVPWRPLLDDTLLEGLAGGSGYRPIWAGDGSSIDIVRLAVQLLVTAGLAAIVLAATGRRR